jgi:hypothetical protein
VAAFRKRLRFAVFYFRFVLPQWFAGTGFGDSKTLEEALKRAVRGPHTFNGE